MFVIRHHPSVEQRLSGRMGRGRPGRRQEHGLGHHALPVRSSGLPGQLSRPCLSPGNVPRYHSISSAYRGSMGLDKEIRPRFAAVPVPEPAPGLPRSSDGGLMRLGPRCVGGPPGIPPTGQTQAALAVSWKQELPLVRSPPLQSGRPTLSGPSTKGERRSGRSPGTPGYRPAGRYHVSLSGTSSPVAPCRPPLRLGRCDWVAALPALRVAAKQERGRHGFDRTGWPPFPRGLDTPVGA